MLSEHWNVSLINISKFSRRGFGRKRPKSSSNLWQRNTWPVLFRCSDRCITALVVDSMQGLSYTNVSTATPSSSTHWCSKRCRVNGATGLPNGVIWAVTIIMKCAKAINTIAHRPSPMWPRTTLGLWAEGSVRKFHEILPHQLSTNGGIEFHLGRRMQTTQRVSTPVDFKATRKVILL